ncbi:hypothetical protein FRC07_010320 [Ceratobasidium sp. 392]|nr:hypothetical protein FRC07_010320 [Ceratobasidium sp. 392]
MMALHYFHNSRLGQDIINVVEALSWMLGHHQALMKERKAADRKILMAVLAAFEGVPGTLTRMLEDMEALVVKTPPIDLDALK